MDPESTDCLPPERQSPRALDWENYKLLYNFFHNYHARWIDNFRVFLAFNAVFIPAEIALLLYAANPANRATVKALPLDMGWMLLGIGLLGATVTVAGALLIKRIHVDTAQADATLAMAEDTIRGDVSVPSRSRTRALFFPDAARDTGLDLGPLPSLGWKGLRAKVVYAFLSFAIVLAHVTLAIIGFNV